MAELEVYRNLNLERVERCMSVMQSGTQMVKLKTGSKGLVRLFYLDEHRSCIRWRPSRKSEKAKITIDSLYKVTEGSQSEVFHRQAEGSLDPSCCFTIYHGAHMDSLDLVTTNAEEARTWVTGLQYLMAGISDEDSLAKRQRTHNQWMKQTFEEADKNGDGLLNIDEIYQLLHKLNVNLPRRKVKQMFQEADTDDQQGTLTYEEFSVFYKMMSTRRDLFLLMMAYSEKKDHLTVDELSRFLCSEQKMTNVSPEFVSEIIEKFEVSDENKQQGILGIEGFTSFMRSPTCDIFNPLHHEVMEDMDQPLSNYFIASSHNTYLTGDQLLSHSKTDMYAWVLQSGCRCVEVDCWDGPDGEPMVQHGYTLTSKIPFKSVIETINKYAFINNQYPVILSIENHCSILQQKKIAQYLREIFADKLDVGEFLSRDAKTLPSPHTLQGKILIKGKRLPSYLSADAEEGEVSDDDSADEIEDDFKLKSNNGHGHHQVESHIRKKLDSLLKESRIGDKEDSDSFSIRALLRATHQGLHKNLRQSSRGVLKKSHSRSLISTLKQKRHSKSRLSCHSVEKEDEVLEKSGMEAGGQINRFGRKRKTMKLSRDLSNLVVFTNSVVSQECLNEGTPGDVLSFSETRAQSMVHHKAQQFLAFNQRQLTRIYPSAYRIDSSNFNPQFYWNVGCQLVALNYQTEGRMMQLNRAKFMLNGGIGYVLKPPAMCSGSFNPFSDDPLPAHPKKQLLLKVISGQQLPKPPDSMLGDRGEIIDPFVEVEIIGLPVDCCKEQTRVVDDNGFNPVWEETLSFTLHMAEVALVRFLVWDHDPIGRDFIGQRTVAFSSLMPGYRHVYLEGLTEASIFVHVSIHEVYGKWSPLVLNPSFTIMHFLGSNKGQQLRGIRGLFNRSSKSSADSNSAAAQKRSVSEHLLRRTASAPAKGRKKKSKMVLSESVAFVSEQKNDVGGAAGGGGGGGGGGEGLEKRLQPRPPLIHRPRSMPLEKLLEGQMSISSTDQDQDPTADTGIGSVPHNRLRSFSVDLLITPSFPADLGVSSLPETHQSQDFNPPEEATYLDISHGGEVGTEEDYVNYLPEDTESELIPTGSEKPEISAPVSLHHDVTSPRFLHNSTISRLIEAMSSDQEQDSCSSVSALIGQFEMTEDRRKLSLLSHSHNMSPHSNLRPSLSSPLKTTPKHMIPGPQQKTKHVNPQIVSQAQVLLSSPEMADLEEVYTILDEEVLSPASEHNGIQNRSHTVDGRTFISLMSSSTKGFQASDRKTSGSKDIEDPVEPVYEEVDDLTAPGREWGLSKRHTSTPLNYCLRFYQDTARNNCSEVEINVDEDPLDMMLTTPRHSSQWEALMSPTKRHAIYQNHQPIPIPQQIQQLSNNNSQSRYTSHKSHVAFSELPYSMGRPSDPQSDHKNTLQNPVKPNSYFQNTALNSKAQNDCTDVRNSFANQRSFSSSQIVEWSQPRHNLEEQGHEEPAPQFHSGFSSSECLNGPPAESVHVSRNRGPWDVVYSRVDYEPIIPSSGVSAPQNPRADTLQSWNHHEALTTSQRTCSQPENRSSAIVDCTALSQCPKSKSLGDLTSEDIRCNFQSKYHIISRSFLTAHTRRQKREVASGGIPLQSQSRDPLTEQLRKLVTFEGDNIDRDGPQFPRGHHGAKSPLQPGEANVAPPALAKDSDNVPPPLTRRLSSRSQSRVRHINSRARERQQEALKPRPVPITSGSSGMGGVVFRNKPPSQNPPANRHSTGSYIAGYLDDLEDRGLPEGACTSLRYRTGDHYSDWNCTDDSHPNANASSYASEPEVYFLLRL